MLNPNANPILQKTEAAIRAKVGPDQQQNMEKIIAAGLKVMDSEQTHGMVVNQLKMHTDPTQIAGVGTAKLMGLLINQSKGVMPMKAGMPAAVVLLCEALDRLEALRRIKVTNENLAAAMQSMASAFMQVLGVSPQQLDKMMQKGAQPAQPAPPTAQPALGGPQPLIGAPA